jgi:hypothetical protein
MEKDLMIKSGGRRKREGMDEKPIRATTLSGIQGI